MDNENAIILAVWRVFEPAMCKTACMSTELSTGTVPEGRAGGGMSWAMVRGGRVWHFWRGDIAACGLRRRSAWTLGSVGAGDCPTCAARACSAQ